MDGLKAGLKIYLEKRRTGEIKLLNPLEKAQHDPKSKRKAINGKCFDCVGRDYDYGYRERIGSCNDKECALWPHRPYQNHKKIVVDKA